MVHFRCWPEGVHLAEPELLLNLVCRIYALAEPPLVLRRHCRAHAEGSRLIARRGDEATLRGIADRDRAASQGRIIALLNRREGVHVDVDDLAFVGFAHGKNHASGMERKKDRLCRSEWARMQSAGSGQRRRNLVIRSAAIRHLPLGNQPSSRLLKPSISQRFLSREWYVLGGLEDAERDRPRVHQR